MATIDEDLSALERDMSQLKMSTTWISWRPQTSSTEIEWRIES